MKKNAAYDLNNIVIRKTHELTDRKNAPIRFTNWLTRESPTNQNVFCKMVICTKKVEHVFEFLKRDRLK